MNGKDGAIRDASVLGVPKMLILGLQHMFAMFGATILVPILVNSYFGEDSVLSTMIPISAILVSIFSPNKKESCLRDSPRAAGRKAIFSLPRAAHPRGAFFIS